MSRPANNPRYPGSVFPLAVDEIGGEPELADALMATQASLLGTGGTGTTLSNIGATTLTIGTAVLRGGSGAPAAGLGAVGDYYFRTDTPTTSLQRIYVKTAAATWTGIV